MSGASNILQIPFRRTHNLRLSEAITKYITGKYDQHPDTFARDLEIIDQLRKDAVSSIEPHTSGIRKLQAYAAQLAWISGKFPIDVSQQGAARTLSVEQNSMGLTNSRWSIR